MEYVKLYFKETRPELARRRPHFCNFNHCAIFRATTMQPRTFPNKVIVRISITFLYHFKLRLFFETFESWLVGENLGASALASRIQGSQI